MCWGCSDHRSKVIYAYSVDHNSFVLAMIVSNDPTRERCLIPIFEREIEILSHLNHSNIIKIFGVIEDEVGFLMENMDGNEY